MATWKSVNWSAILGERDAAAAGNCFAQMVEKDAGSDLVNRLRLNGGAPHTSSLRCCCEWPGAPVLQHACTPKPHNVICIGNAKTNVSAAHARVYCETARRSSLSICLFHTKHAAENMCFAGKEREGFDLAARNGRPVSRQEQAAAFEQAMAARSAARAFHLESQVKQRAIKRQAREAKQTWRLPDAPGSPSKASGSPGKVVEQLEPEPEVEVKVDPQLVELQEAADPSEVREAIEEAQRLLCSLEACDPQFRCDTSALLGNLDEFCINNGGFCIKNGGLCVTNDGFCDKNDELYHYDLSIARHVYHSK